MICPLTSIFMAQATQILILLNIFFITHKPVSIVLGISSIIGSPSTNLSALQFTTTMKRTSETKLLM